MTKHVLKIGVLTVVIVAGISCNQPPSSSTPAAPATAPDHGRFQIVVAPQGERGTQVFLVDTRDGSTWFFQPPQGALINGFWSNIPRLTFGDQYWEQVMRTMFTPAAGTNALSGTSTQRTATVALPKP